MTFDIVLIDCKYNACHAFSGKDAHDFRKLFLKFAKEHINPIDEQNCKILEEQIAQDEIKYES